MFGERETKVAQNLYNLSAQVLTVLNVSTQQGSQPSAIHSPGSSHGFLRLFRSIQTLPKWAQTQTSLA